MEISKEIEQKAQELVREGKVKKEIETDKRIHYRVRGETEEHFVIFDKSRSSYACDCRYFALQGKECSHIVAARMLKEK
jgi:hypothetical protein